MGKLNVLMTTMEYDVIKVGGLSAALTSIAEAARKYTNPRIILPRSGFNVPWEKVEERRYRYVNMEVFEHNGVAINTLSNAVLDDPQIYPEPEDVKAIKKFDEFGDRLIEVIDDIDFDVVHMHDLFAYKAMGRFKEMGKPVLLTIHRLHREHPNWFFTETVALEKADFITVVGKSYYQEDEKELFKRYEGKVTHVSNGIDTRFWNAQMSSYPRLSRRERRKKTLNSYGLEDAVFYLYVGRFDPVQKGVDILLRTSEEFLRDNDAKMIIVGVGDRKLEKWSKELQGKHPSKLKVINKLLPAEYVRDFYSSADFALVPSVFEPFGLVQLEAMSCGCIPIGSKTGGIK
ncbi:MAG: glycosyltransferase, partial [Candidatus Heimdallarchaeota archaeon]